MANVIIKSSERQARTNKVVRDFGHNSSTASRQAREYAECIAQRSHEVIKKAEGLKR
ncbi:MAG: hypothetical protein HPY50_03515 [Firmicutes bacterium]|nr:hypothetical protein [Bacillota bacterium]